MTGPQRPQPPTPPRLAVRAVILRDDRLLLVNAWKGRTHLWCAPGGGVEAHASLHDNLCREVMEETGLRITVGAPCLVNEFHDPAGTFHQVDLYFRCTLIAGDPDGDWPDGDWPDGDWTDGDWPDGDWTDPEGIVSHRRWVTRAEMAGMLVKPDSLAAVAWGDADAPGYDPLEPILR